MDEPANYQVLASPAAGRRLAGRPGISQGFPREEATQTRHRARLRLDQACHPLRTPGAHAGSTGECCGSTRNTQPAEAGRSRDRPGHSGQRNRRRAGRQQCRRQELRHRLRRQYTDARYKGLSGRRRDLAACGTSRGAAARLILPIDQTPYPLRPRPGPKPDQQGVRPSEWETRIAVRPRQPRLCGPAGHGSIIDRSQPLIMGALRPPRSNLSLRLTISRASPAAGGARLVKAGSCRAAAARPTRRRAMSVKIQGLVKGGWARAEMLTMRTRPSVTRSGGLVIAKSGPPTCIAGGVCTFGSRLDCRPRRLRTARLCSPTNLAIPGRARARSRSRRSVLRWAATTTTSSLPFACQRAAADIAGGRPQHLRNHRAPAIRRCPSRGQGVPGAQTASLRRIRVHKDTKRPTGPTVITASCSRGAQKRPRLACRILRVMLAPRPRPPPGFPPPRQTQPAHRGADANADPAPRAGQKPVRCPKRCRE